LLDDSLGRFLEAYRRGVAGMGSHAPAWTSAVFDDRLREHLEARCDLMELLRVRAFLDYRKKGLVAARQGRLDSSGLEFRKAEDSLQSLKRSEVRLFCESLYSAALAYLRYRAGQSERSRELIGRALAIDTELEAEVGSGVLYGHKFQLVENLIRVEARFGDPELATRRGLELLEQLEGRPGAAPTAHCWRPSDREKLPSALRRTLANRLVLELATIHLGTAARGAIARLFGEHVHGCRVPPDDRAAEAHAWFGFATAVEGSTLAETVDLSARYLAGGPGDFPPLWYCVVLQCVERLSQADSAAAKTAASAILSDRNGWPLAPASLRGPSPLAARHGEVQPEG
jgi:hypothetical protein